MRLVGDLNIGPEYAQTPAIDRWDHLMRLDVERNLYPTGPGAIDERTMIKTRRLGERTRDDVNGPGQRVRTGSSNKEMRDLIEAVDIVESDRLEVIRGVLVLVDLLLKLLEDFCAV